MFKSILFCIFQRIEYIKLINVSRHTCVFIVWHVLYFVPFYFLCVLWSTDNMNVLIFWCSVQFVPSKPMLFIFYDKLKMERLKNTNSNNRIIYNIVYGLQTIWKWQDSKTLWKPFKTTSLDRNISSIEDNGKWKVVELKL